VQPETAQDYTDYDCSAPEVMACGVTQVPKQNQGYQYLHRIV